MKEALECCKNVTQLCEFMVSWKIGSSNPRCQHRAHYRARHVMEFHWQFRYPQRWNLASLLKRVTL